MRRMLFVGGLLHGEVKQLPDAQPSWVVPIRGFNFSRREIYTRQRAYTLDAQEQPRFFWVMTCTDSPYMLDEAIRLAQAADPDWRPDYLERPPDDRP